MKLTITGVAQAISLTSLKTKSFSVQAGEVNTGNIYLGESAAQIAAGARHALTPSAAMSFEVDYSYGDEDQISIDLSEVFIHGNLPGDLVLVSYMEASEVQY